MRNVQIITNEESHCSSDIFSATEEEFDLLFAEKSIVAFMTDVQARLTNQEFESVFSQLSARKCKKSEVSSIDGILFYGLDSKNVYHKVNEQEILSQTSTGLNQVS